MSPLDAIEQALGDARRAHGRIQAALEVAREHEALRSREEPAEFRPAGFACTVGRDLGSVTITVRMCHATLSLPMPPERARELAALLLIRSEEPAL